MRVRRMVFRVEMPASAGHAGVPLERAVALVREALARAAAEAPTPGGGRIARLTVRVDAAAAGDRALAARIGRAIRAAVSERAVSGQTISEQASCERASSGRATPERAVSERAITRPTPGVAG
jgi:hypothetical protein